MNYKVVFVILCLSTSLTIAQGHCLYFGGSGYVSVANNSSLNPTTAITVEAWIKASNFSPFQPVLDKRWNENTDPWSSYCLVIATDARPYAMISTGTWGSSINTYSTSVSTINTNTWYHVAFTYSNSDGKLKCYTNGTLQYTSNTTLTIGYNTLSLRIGAASTSDGQYFRGYIDDVRIWSTALSQTTLQDWRNVSVTSSHPNYANLVGYWKFDEGSGTTTADASGNSNTGTLTGTMSWVDSDAPLPVELISFNGNTNANSVTLNWQTSTEVNNYGFSVERRTKSEEWIKIGFVNGSGNSNSTKNYSYIDYPSGGTLYSYRLKQIDFDGKFEYSSIIEVNLDIPQQFNLEQNHPNPFNPITTINYSIPFNGNAKLVVYDVLGREIAKLFDEFKYAGNHHVEFDASYLNSGIYFYKLIYNAQSLTKRMILIK